MNATSHFKLSALVGAALACALGCNDDASDRGESGALATIDDPSVAEAGDAGSVDGGIEDGGSTTVLDGGIDGGGAPPTDGGIVPNPSATYFVSVTPNGTGCPEGTTNTSISPDGASFKTTLEAYEVSLNSTTADLTVTKNCVLSIKIHTPQGTSIAVSRFGYSGYAFLEQGVTAGASAYYRFQGAAVMPNTQRTTKVGPFDNDFIFVDEVRTADLVWSPCGVDRELIVSTQLQLKNSTPKRSGYANITEFPLVGSLDLTFQRCNAPLPPAVLPSRPAP